MLEKLKREVLKANLYLVKYGLVCQTWGNVSGIDRSKGLIVIKPSGIEYDKMKIDDMVVVDFEGKIIEGKRRPSSDTPTHIELYKAFPSIGGITHTHSLYATMFAQANCEIPCYGTTHADTFYRSIPVTRFLTKKEIETNYEKNTGKVIIERFRELNSAETPGVLVAGHAPFTWGKDAIDSVKNAQTLEYVAQLAFGSLLINPKLKTLPNHIIKKHYERKHGPNAYYGQKNFNKK
ncbi:MAG: L-ribulose-5-phosphate 4-epimerase [Melioribacter sp.]|uniref:L-ribulose-5-phosphate 4-epimerase n=1 Tax=Rosettibacter primus TaxID=3111523 RepID=UPI00247BD46C|nr:L-ribulose-5-phosphate 4-epimerase [Melioribacter sp.]